MPQIIIGPGLEKIDGSLQKATYGFLTKLATDDTLLGLHIEPINNSVDPRARTGRVDISNRAVLFKLQGSQQDASYVFIGTFPHDEAIAIAQKSRLNINPRNGVAELVPVTDEIPGAVKAVSTAAPPPVAAVVEEPTLRARGYTVDDFTDLGMDSAFASGALDLSGSDAVLEYAETAPAAWQGSALLDLYTGESFSSIREKYGLTTAPAAADSLDDDSVLEAMRHPAALMEFAFIEDDDELRAAIENPDFSAWRIFLHPEQRAYTTRSYNGPFRLSGGAGTGKTVVLLHRARELYRRNPGSRIVLSTFSRTLAESLKEQFQVLDPSVPLASDLGKSGVYIAGVDAIAHRIVATAGEGLAGANGNPGAVAEVLGPRTAQVLKPTNPQAWANAIDEHGDNLPADLQAQSFLEAEYSTVVLPNVITSREDYLSVRRPGRGVALKRSRRNAVWDVVEAYRASASADGTSDFEEKAAIAARWLDRRGSERPADHVLVDEAQDLSPSRLMLLRSLAEPQADDLFLAEDSHQRIYGQRIVLSKYGINIVGRSRRLMLNYRTTQQNLHYALGILAGEQYTDLGDEPETASGYRSARRGPAPQVIAVQSLTEEYDEVTRMVREWVAAGTSPRAIGLLVPTRKEAEALPRALGDRGVTVAFIDRDSAGPPDTPQVMTMHRSKGMEFAKVILVGVGDNNVPRRYQIDALPEGDRADALQRERSLLYVAATRARDELVVIYTGDPSDLLPTA